MGFYQKVYTKLFFKKHLPEDLQLRFLSYLQRNLLNGYSLIEALERVKWDKQLKKIATQMITSLKGGQSVDEAFAEAKFHYTISTALSVVKENGNLLKSIERCIEGAEKRKQYKQKFKQVIRYPFVLFLLFIILLNFIKKSILPTFDHIFHSRADIQNTVKYIFIITDYVIPLTIAFIIATLVLSLNWHRFRDNYDIQKLLNIYRKIPIYRSFLKMNVSYEFATYMSTLFKSGLPMNEILQTMSKQKNDAILSYYSNLMLRTLIAGKPITTLLAELPFIEQQIVDIFEQNNDKHTLAKDLSSFAEMISSEMHRKIQYLLTIIQPILFAFMAILIIILYLLLMTPMIRLINHL